jgi:hypothetical protein
VSGAAALPSRSHKSDVLLPALLFVGLLLVYAGFEHSRDWNTASRLLLTYSIVQHHTVEVTAFVTKNGQLHDRTHTKDLASPAPGHYFCDKAPGQSFLGVIPYWICLRLGLTAEHPVGTDAVRFWPADYWVTLLTSGVLTAATAVVIYGFLRLLVVGRFSALAAALAYGLATIALVYATLFYGHASAGFCAIYSVYLLYRWPGRRLTAFLGGAVAGLGVVIEYPQVVVPVTITIVIFLAAASGRREFSFRTLGFFIAGGLAPAVLLGWYHARVTGSPLRFPYQYEVLPLFAYHREGSGIPIGVPSGQVVWELLFGRRRGLLWFSPVAFAGLPGLWQLVRRGEWPLAAIIAGQFLGVFYINAGFPNWDAGWSTGPRFLLAALPLVMVSAGFWLGPAGRPRRCLWWIWGAAAVLSAALLVAFHCVGGRVHPQFARPFADSVMPMLRFGRVEPHAGEYLVRLLGVKTQSGWPGLAVTTLFIAAVAGGLVLLAWRCERRDRRSAPLTP